MKHILLIAALAATPAAGQIVQPLPGSVASDPGDRLSAHLRTLAARPRDLSALLSAGQAALEAGDPNAALGFFVRAQDVDGRNGRAKAGLAAALVQLEKPDDALRHFGEAVASGVAEADIAGDRGLAYDLRGDSRRAQADYERALRRGPNDEITRRLALSQGISGDRDAALATLAPLLARQDRAAWRARSFILAMTGDVPGANATARQVMPAGLAASMAPFLARLPRLNAAERAQAVTFGTMPSEGQALASVRLGDPYRPAVPPAASPPAPSVRADAGLIPRGAPLGRPSPASGPAQAATPPATRTTTASASDQRVNTRIGGRIAPIGPSATADEPPQRVAQVTTGVLPPPGVRPAAPADTSAVIADAPLFETPAVAPDSPRPPAPAIAASPTPVSATPAPTATGLASVIAALPRESESAPLKLPTLAEIRARQRAEARKASEAAAAASAEKAARAEREAALAKAKAHPARHWVQVAMGSNEAGLPLTWRRIRDAHPALKPYQGHSLAARASNRVLAGPVKSAADARALVNALAKTGLAATTFSSEAGQEVVKLAAR